MTLDRQQFKDIGPMWNSRTSEYTTDHSRPLIGIRIRKGSARSDLIVPNLSCTLGPLHLLIIMPAISIKTNTELESPAIINGRGDVPLIQQLVAIQPELIFTSAIRLPSRLDDNLMPLSSRDSRKARERFNLLRTDAALFDAGVELVANQPDHAGGHVIIAAGVAEVGDELGDVVRLGWGELPVLLETEGEAVETGVAALVDVVLDYFRVVASRVAGVVDLRHLQGCGALVDDVSHFLYSAAVFLIGRAPARGCSRVAEDLGG